MKGNRATFLPLIILLTILTTTAIAAPVKASSDSNGNIFQTTTLIGVPVGMTGTTGAIRGVNAGGVPWVVAEGLVTLHADGTIHVVIQGLLITGTGTALDGTIGPVRGVRASLTCQGTNVTATTGVFPLSSSGDGQIKDIITLPSTCVGPIILIRVGATASNPGPLLGPWIATTGF
jgi:hypothetical protein